MLTNNDVQHLLLGKHSYPCLMFTILSLVGRTGTAIQNSEMKRKGWREKERKQERKAGGREGRKEGGRLRPKA